MIFTLVTLFPEFFQSSLSSSIIGRAALKKLVSFDFINPRDFATDKHQSVDDSPYGGGVGMVIRVDVMYEAIQKAKKHGSHVVLLTPQGEKFDQKKAVFLSKKKHLVLVCGHYEGFDERIRDFAHEELSIGDFVLTSGEVAANVVVDSIVRLLPGVLGKDESSRNESFSHSEDGAILEYPQYTRPENFKGKKVPGVLLSGNHAEIANWRKNESITRTKKRRPDLLKSK